MAFYTSSREKKLWNWTFLVIAGIYSSLIFGGPLAKLLHNQDMSAVIFLLSMALIAFLIGWHGLSQKPGKAEMLAGIAVFTVYLMVFLRLTMTERSHLIEYSALSLLIYAIYQERVNNGKAVRFPGLVAIVITALIGALDETLQLFIPNRVFDVEDIVFNSMAATFAVASSFVIGVVGRWAKARIARNKQRTD